MRRPPGKYLILASLVGSLAFWGYLILFGTLRIVGSETIGWIQIAIFLGLGALALWLLIRRRLVGALLCAVFYGVQVISVTFRSGYKFEFNSLPTIYLRIYGDAQTPTKLNVVSLILFLLSIGLWVVYRQARDNGGAPTPNKSLERTREG
jgi:hypothetical protein